jgi:serine/threonine-protein kinase
MLAGRPLIRHGTVGEMMAAMSQPVVPELPGLRPDVDAALDAVVRRALGAKPDERYARSDELARALTGELLRTGASVGAEEVGQFVRTLCPEAFEAQRQLIAKVTSASGHRRTPTPGTGYGTGQQPAAPVSGFEPTMMRGLDGTPRGEAASSTVHVEGLEAVDPGATAPRKPSRPVPTAGQEAALEPAASRKRPMGLYAAIAVLLVIATAATTALFVRQPAAPVAAVEPASPASPGAPPSGTASAEGTASAGPTAGSASPGVSPTGSVSAGVPPTGAASGGSTAAGTASAGSTAAGSTGSSASAVGTASAASSGTGTPATGTPAAGTPDTQDGTVVPATAQGTQVAAAVPSAGSALPDDDRTSAHPTRTPPRKKPAVQPVRHISPKRPVQASEAAEAADAVTPEAPAVDAGTPAPAKPEVVKLDGYAKKKGGVAGFVGDHITVRNPSTQDWTGCWVVKDQRKASYLGNVKSTEEQSTVRKFTQHPTLEVGSGMVGVFCNEGSFTQKLE